MLAALILLSSASFASCEKETPAEVQTEAETTEAAPEPYDYTDSRLTIVRPEDTSSVIVEALKELKTSINDKYGVTLTLSGDWLKPDTEAPEFEILLGDTNREETALAKSELKNGTFTIRIVNGKLVIVGKTDDLTAEAVTYFIENIIPAGKTLPMNFVYTSQNLSEIGSLKINGTDIGECCAIVYKTLAYKSCAETLQSIISERAGVKLDCLKNSSEAAHEIVFTKEFDAKVLGYDDYRVAFADGSIVIAGGSSWAIETAMYGFIDDCLSSGGDIDLAVNKNSVLISYDIPDRQAYIIDPTLYSPHWTYQWKPEAHMLDYQEKIDALTQTNKNHLFTVSHRGDFLFHPENSIEAYISVWAMGGDCLEIDIQYTKDGVPIIMHDATLSRMTDSANYIGKDGYPSTANVSDWTLEQIKVLHLREGQGGSSAAVTPYVVATLEEVLTFAKGRIFLIIDKQANWRYCDIAGIQTMSKANFIYPYMLKTGNFESVLISYGTIDSSTAGTLSAADALKIQKYVYDNTGAKMYFFLRCWTTRNTVTPYAKTLTDGSMTNCGLLVNGAFDPTNSGVINTVKSIRKQYPSALIGGWTIDTNGYDAPETWDIMYKAGYRSIMTNNMYALVQYASKK